MNSSILSTGSSNLGTGVFFALGLILIFLAPRRRSHQFLALWVFTAAFGFILQQAGLNLAANGAADRILLNITRLYGIVAVIGAVLSVHGVIHFLNLQANKTYQKIMIGVSVWATVNLAFLTIIITESTWLTVPFEFGRSPFNPFDFTSFILSDSLAIAATSLSTAALLIVINWLNFLLFWRNDVPNTARAGSVLFIMATFVALSPYLEWLLPWVIMAGGITVTHAVLTSCLFDPLRKANLFLENSLAEEQTLALQLEKTVADIEAKVLTRRQELKEALEREQSLASGLERTLLQKSELNILKTQIISNVSHEFRTPLTIIKSSSDLLTRYYERLSQDKRQQYQSEIVTQIFYLDEMLRELLFINRSNSKGIFAQIERFDSYELCKRLQSHWELTFGQNIAIRFTNEEPLQQVICTDIGLIQRIGDSLILNAIKFSNDKTELTIQFKFDTHFELLFSDTGIGIPFSEQDSVFELFKRGSNVGTRRGLGLGLFTVRKLVATLGGEIMASANKPQGTTFSISLPLAEDSHDLATSAAKLLV